MPAADVIDRKIRREVGKILWCLAKGKPPRADVRLMPGEGSAVDHAAVDLIELYEKSADCTLTELYEGWQNAVNSDRSPEHFAYVLVAEAFDMLREAGFESLLCGGRPTFAIELHGTDLTWDGELREPERCNPAIPSQEDYLGETLGAPELTSLVTNPTARRTLPKEDLELFGAVEGYEDDHGNIVTYERGDGPGAEERTVDGKRVKVVRVARKRHARGRPPWLPNPGGSGGWVGRHVVVGMSGDPEWTGVVTKAHPEIGSSSMLAVKPDKGGPTPWIPARHVALETTRLPTLDELAKAWAYIEREYTLKEGNIDGVQWAEALAFVASHPSYAYVDADDRRVAEEMFPQLTEAEWRMIAARADYMLVSEGDKPRFKAPP